MKACSLPNGVLKIHPILGEQLKIQILHNALCYRKGSKGERGPLRDYRILCYHQRASKVRRINGSRRAFINFRPETEFLQN
ncbi:hypothetical protein CEXT_516141 [Caerostris extrusa]|uniref:Uncharacterized protein n=1 Tax=Caerostris extrusa TaxID=172846 RepID=A0AAV4T8K2_CAEEX|nr:hypothetical protein CEXT_516141 [Caerostris extrusa]